MSERGLLRPVWLERQTILKRRSWIYYLIIIEAAASYWAKQIEVQPDERFFEVLAKHVEAYVHKGEMPPNEIESAIMNVADDFIAGRDIVLRAGDYITLQNFMRR